MLGSGKTAVDACVWLLDNEIEPDRIRSVRPRDHWFHHRRHYQALDLVGGNIEGISLDAQAGAEAKSIDDLFERLEASGRLVRIDPSAKATMYRSTMLSPAELDALRQIEDVVRLGHVRRIEGDRIVLAEGETDSGSDVVHVDCTAQGLSPAPPVPIFQDEPHRAPADQAELPHLQLGAHRLRRGSPARRRGPRTGSAHPIPYPSSVDDWPGMTRRTWKVEQQWLSEPDLAGWIAESRLNLLKGLPDHAGDPAVRESLERYLTNVGPASSGWRSSKRTAELDSVARLVPVAGDHA